MTRRNVFAVGGQALGVTAGLALAPLFEEQGDEWQAVGPVSEYTKDSYTTVVLTIVPGIGESGKTTAYVRRGDEDLEEDENGFIAISTLCAHLGCPVRFVEAAGNFICPCHGGVYDFEGKVIGGPPVRPLDRFQTRVTGDTLEVGPRYSVTNDLEPVRARDPGEFTGGIWEYLYPPRPTTAPPPS